MNIVAISAQQGIATPETPLMRQAIATDFAAMMASGLERVDDRVKAAESRSLEVASGGATPLHELAVSMEKARLELMLAVEVRNKLVEAYQELSRMQL